MEHIAGYFYPSKVQRNTYSLRLIIFFIALMSWTGLLFAQDIEPRRWAQMPTGLSFVGVGLGHIEGDIFFDPLLLVENADFDMQVLGLGYVRSFSFFGKSARVDVNLPYLAGRWEGTVDGQFVNFRRRGLGDARLRLSVLLYGGPAISKAEFAKSQKSNTVVGAAISVSIPTGEYSSDRLINLGSNRWVLRPQLGVTHTRGKWSGELTGSVFLYADNDEFWQQTKLKTDPLVALQAHLIYSFRPGLWAAGGIAYGWGGEAIVNGVSKNNISGNLLTALSFGYPLSPKQGVKLTLLTGRTQKSTGVDIDSLIFSYSLMF